MGILYTLLNTCWLPRAGVYTTVWEEVAHGNGSISVYHSNQTIKDVWLNLLVSVHGLPNVNRVKELNS